MLPTLRTSYRPLPDFGELARDYLGDIGASRPLQDMLRVVATGAAVERRERSGAGRAKALQRAGRLAARLGQAMVGLDERAVIGALRQAASAPSEATATSGLLDGFVIEPLYRQVAAVAQAPILFTRLGKALEGAAERVPVPDQGRLDRSDALSFGIESLLALWHAYRPGTPPTQGTIKGRFGGLAAALFADEPCNFGDATVRHAVAESLPSTKKSRGPAQQLPVAPIVAPRRVLIVGAETGLGQALAASYREAGAVVVSATWEAATPLPRTAAACRAELRPAEQVLDQFYGVVVLIPPEVDAAVGEAVMSAIALRPEQLVRALLKQSAGAPPQRIVLLSPVVSPLAHDPQEGLRFLRAARAAQLSFIQSLAASADHEQTTIVAVAPAWGTSPDGKPLRASGLKAEARILAATIVGIPPDRTGEILDLHGSRLPF